MNSVANDGPEARGLNAALVVLYWQIGQRIRTDILRYQRAEYGEEILPTLSAKLVPEFGQGFSSRNLARMISLADAFPDQQSVVTLSRELGWCHFVELGSDFGFLARQERIVVGRSRFAHKVS